MYAFCINQVRFSSYMTHTVVVPYAILVNCFVYLNEKFKKRKYKGKEIIKI